MKLRWFFCGAIAGLVCIIQPVQAGLLGKVGAIFDKKIEYRVSVVDEQGKHVPYATLWFLFVFIGKEERSLTDMQRLQTRYAIDYDATALGNNYPIDGIHKRFANFKGAHAEELQENSFEGRNELRMLVGALKRGYRVGAVEKTMPVGSQNEIVIRLQKDDSQVFDSRLLLLDEVRFEVGKAMPEWNMAQRADFVDRQYARLKQLAEIFEQEGKREEAAMVYFNLAYLPSIERMRGYDGKEQIIGFSRDYDEKSPRRKADLEKALALGAENPYLRARKLIDDFKDKRGRIWADQSPELTLIRQQFIRDMEQHLSLAKERVLPEALRLLADTYLYVGNPHKACEMLTRLYRFEPRAYVAQNWKRIFGYFEDEARHSTLGLPVFENFSCKVPV